MGIGAKDYIDQKLVKKYANLKMDNTDRTNVTELAVSAERMLQVMNDYGSVQRHMITLQQKMRNLCQSANAVNAYSRVQS